MRFPSVFKSSAPPAPSLRFILLSSLGAGLAIAATGWLSLISGTPWLMAPFGASCVLAFGVPDSPLAQPRAIIGGHLIATLIGLITVQLIGDSWIALALAVAIALAAMQLTRTLHPPAGANPIVVIAAQAPFSYLVSPVLAGSLVIVAIACAINHLQRPGSYPHYWL